MCYDDEDSTFTAFSARGQRANVTPVLINSHERGAR